MLLREPEMTSEDAWNKSRYAPMFKDMTPEEYDALRRADTQIRGDLTFVDDQG